MKRLDPRSKIFLSLTIFILSVLYRSIYPLLFFLWFSLMLCIFAGAELGKMFGKMKWITVILTFISIAVMMVSQGGEVFLEYNEYIFLSKRGLETAFIFLVHSYIFLVLCCYIGTSTQREIIQALIAAKLPYELALFFTFPARFIPILSDEYNSSLRILIMKGINIKTLPTLQKINLYTYLWSSTSSNAMLKSREFSVSMETRGLKLIDEYENVYSTDLKIIDYFVIFWSIMVLSAGLLWKFL